MIRWSKLAEFAKTGEMERKDLLKILDLIKIHCQGYFTQAFRCWYRLYQSSIYWEVLKAEVIIRSGGICEKCNVNMFYAPHHLTYKRVGNEKPEDVIGVCDDCHKKAHFLIPEDELKKMDSDGITIKSI